MTQCASESPKGWHYTLESPHKLPHKAFGLGNGVNPPYDVWPAPPEKPCEETMYPWQGAHHDPSKVVNKIEFIKFFRQTTGCSLMAAKDFADKVYDDFKLLYEEESKAKPISYDFGMYQVSQPVKQIMTEILDELDAKDTLLHEKIDAQVPDKHKVVFKPGFKPYTAGYEKPVKPIVPIGDFLDMIVSDVPLEVIEPEPAITTVDEALSTYYKEEVEA